MSKRIILIGPSAAGKTFISEHLQQSGHRLEISYTSREMRPGEVNGVEYHFLSKEMFKEKINRNEFYEHTQYEGNYYGTGKAEFYNADVFVWETHGVQQLRKNDRKESTIFLVNTSVSTRIQRMKERGWDLEKISNRIRQDNVKFDNFNDYDLTIQSM